MNRNKGNKASERKHRDPLTRYSRSPTHVIVLLLDQFSGPGTFLTKTFTVSFCFPGISYAVGNYQLSDELLCLRE